MIRYAVMSAVLVAAACTGPAHAQAVVEDPGYCAQYYPNANCTNYGPGNPLYSGSFRSSGPPAAYRGPYAATAPVVVPHAIGTPITNEASARAPLPLANWPILPDLTSLGPKSFPPSDQEIIA